jgi:subtilisin family serine protease
MDLGVKILSTYIGNQYRKFSGTSMAAPHVTGVAALMLSYIQTFQPGASVHDIFDTLRSTAQKSADITAGRTGNFEQIGIVDAYAAVEALANGLQNRVDLVPDDPSQCKHEVRLELSTDSKGFETAYRLKRLSDGENIWLESPNTLDNNAEYSETTCLDDNADACYRFDVRDMGQDGIDGSGIRLYYKGHELYHGGSFGSGGMLKFGEC